MSQDVAMDTSGEDTWTSLSNGWARNHFVKRNKLYVPDSGPGNPDTTSFGDTRLSKLQFSNGDTLQIEDNWRVEDSTLLQRYGLHLPGLEWWTGSTEFYFKPKAEHNFADPLKPELYEGKKATSLSIPELPSEAVRRAHNLTHFPFQTWCEHCTSGKGREDYTKRKEKDFKANCIRHTV